MYSYQLHLTGQTCLTDDLSYIIFNIFYNNTFPYLNIYIIFKTDPDNLSAFVFGYTGGAGRAIVNALAVEPRFKRVVLFGRRIVDLDKEKESSSQKIPGDFTKFRQDVVDFDKLSENSEYFAEKLKDFDVGIYTLGVNPFNSDEQTFNRITKDWLLAVGKLAKDGGCKHFHKMSGMLVKQNSWLKVIYN